MHQRSDSSVKGVHRGRQQKRIGRQQLQSSSSSAVAAAGAEAAWRGLDRVHELCWQMIERALLGGGIGDEWVAGRVRRLGSGDVKRGAISLPSERIGCHWFGFHPDLGALGWQD